MYMKRSVAFVLAFFVLALSCGFLSVYDVLCAKEDSVKMKNGHLFEEKEPMNKDMADYAVKLFRKISDTYLSDNECYFLLIPDKYMYLSDKKSDYDEYYEYIKKSLTFAKMIEVYDLIDESDYYFTDMHLRQEKTVDIARRVSEAMGNDVSLEFEKVDVESEFFGNYADEYKGKIPQDKLVYLTNDTVNNLTTKENISIYDFEKLVGDEPYEFFLSGNQSVVTINNENAGSEKRLVVFRDSFASSFAPLISESYSEIVLVDLRYIMSDMVDEYVDFENADVLFMYSATLINSSLCMR